jgi:2-aminoadipate transaminase
MRDLMAITERPDVISLAGGLPDTSAFPGDEFMDLMSEIASDRLARALQYGPTEGSLAARETVCRVMAAEGASAEPEDVLITTGGQQGLDLIAKVLIDPGDVIIAEGPTYPGAISAFTSYEARIEHIAIDHDGMDPQRLRERLADLDSEGATVKFLYLIPNFQNPAGVTLSLERRREILEIANARDLLIVEDNPYGLLRYEGDPIPTMTELDGGRSVVYLGTFSKILSPGLRLGWMVAPKAVQRKLNLGKQAADLCASSLAQQFVTAFLNDGAWSNYMDNLRGIYSSRRNAMLDSLSTEFPASASWSVPKGGLFLWATLPDYIDTTDLLARALRENVAFVPGSAAWVNGSGKSSMRLNFSGSTEAEIREGIRRIGAVVSEQVELFETMTGVPRAERQPAERMTSTDSTEPPNEAQSSGQILPFPKTGEAAS